MPDCRSLAIIVTTPPARGDLDAAFDLARAARVCGAEVSMFIAADALLGLPGRRDEIASLVSDGCRIAVCAQSAATAGLAAEDLGVPLGGLEDRAAIVSRADRVVSFT